MPRKAAGIVREALADTRVVLVNGARQSGKSTLVRHLVAGGLAEWRTLDNPATFAAARADPLEFVSSAELMVIDEIQRAPELLLPIKLRVDSHPAPGQFLLTGSSRVLGMRQVPDTLPGRVETIELWPFSQGELDGSPDAFVDAAFEQGPDLHHVSTLTRADYVARVVRGGFPEAVARSESRRRRRFFDAYIRDLVTREVRQLSDITQLGQMRDLIRLLAARSGHLLVPTTLGREVGLPQRTVERYLALLEEVFLIKRIPAWSRNLTTRVVGTSKVAMVDSGLACALVGADEALLTRPDGPFGALLEGFVLMELARQHSWGREGAELHHYRTKDKVEVDAVLANRRSQVVAVEVKASSTVRAEDFAGLRHLERRLGADFVVGIVLYTGTQTLPFGPRLRAMPISALWQASPD